MTSYDRVTQFLHEAGAVRVAGDAALRESTWTFGRKVLMLRQAPDGALELYTLLTRSTSSDAIMDALADLRMGAPRGHGPGGHRAAPPA